MYQELSILPLAILLTSLLAVGGSSVAKGKEHHTPCAINHTLHDLDRMHPENRTVNIKPQVVVYIEDIFKAMAKADKSGHTVYHSQPVIGEKPMTSEQADEEIIGWNIVLEVRGERWGTSEDQIAVIGAHHDVCAGTKGINDNGSGVAVLREVARNITKQKVCRKNTIIFVTFDAEETGLKGSHQFVNKYLIPEILEKYHISPDTFHGAYIMDTIMNYDETPNSQNVSGLAIQQMFPEEYAILERNKFRGDFLTAFGRSDVDNDLLTHIKNYWTNATTSLHPIRTDPSTLVFPLGIESAQLKGDNPVVRNILRSDHSSFWLSRDMYSPENGLKAVLFTDTADLRGYMKQCYHAPCDNISYVTEERLEFLTTVSQGLASILSDVSEVMPHNDALCLTTGFSVASYSWYTIGLAIFTRVLQG